MDTMTVNRGGVRNSNLELYRILVMLLIIAHHYVANSGVVEDMYASFTSRNTIFLFLFGAWGKTGINCFVLITGYFMCMSTITIRKFLKLVLEVEFYTIVFYLIFVFSGYETVSLARLVQVILPVTSISTNFIGCYLTFYLFIPFLNILVRNMNEKQHLILLGLLGFTYVFFGTMPNFTVNMNYVSWFICLFFLGSYIRLYPKKVFSSTKVWAVSTIVLLGLGALSVVFCIYTDRWPYSFVNDSNTLLAVCLGVSSFLLFKNLNIRQSKFINTVAASTFGVLCIHANSDAMRQWLWQSVLNVKGMFYNGTGAVVLHAFLSVLGVFILCTLIDMVRIRVLEKRLLDKAEYGVRRLRSKWKDTHE